MRALSSVPGRAAKVVDCCLVTVRVTVSPVSTEVVKDAPTVASTEAVDDAPADATPMDASVDVVAETPTVVEVLISDSSP